MTADAIQRLLDRDAIREVLFRYCRGIDRKCRRELDQVYWPDATDDHGAGQGPVPAPLYIDRVLAGIMGMRTTHHLTNILIEFDGQDDARSEAGFLALHELTDADGADLFVQLSGRYLDRFERRGDKWRIARRVLVFDFEQTLPAGDWTGAFLPTLERRGAAFPDDPLYAMMALSGEDRP